MHADDTAGETTIVISTPEAEQSKRTRARKTTSTAPAESQNSDGSSAKNTRPRKTTVANGLTATGEAITGNYNS